MCPRLRLQAQIPLALLLPPQGQVGGQHNLLPGASPNPIAWGPRGRRARLSLWKELRGLEDITRLSDGGRRSEFRRGSRRRTRRVRGLPRHKARFVLRSPRELEPMDWRQLRSSVRQRRGSDPGKRPRGRAGRMGRQGSVCAGPLTRPLSPGTLRQVAALIGASVCPCVQQGR